jgi:hypothetical protein
MVKKEIATNQIDIVRDPHNEMNKMTIITQIKSSEDNIQINKIRNNNLPKSLFKYLNKMKLFKIKIYLLLAMVLRDMTKSK